MRGKCRQRAREAGPSLGGGRDAGGLKIPLGRRQVFHRAAHDDDLAGKGALAPQHEVQPCPPGEDGERRKAAAERGPAMIQVGPERSSEANPLGAGLENRGAEMAGERDVFVEVPLQVPRVQRPGASSARQFGMIGLATP